MTTGDAAQAALTLYREETDTGEENDCTDNCFAADP